MGCPRVHIVFGAPRLVPESLAVEMEVEKGFGSKRMYRMNSIFTKTDPLTRSDIDLFHNLDGSRTFDGKSVDATYFPEEKFAAKAFS